MEGSGTWPTHTSSGSGLLAQHITGTGKISAILCVSFPEQHMDPSRTNLYTWHFGTGFNGHGDVRLMAGLNPEGISTEIVLQF